MKLLDLVNYGKNILKNSNKENILFDTLCILEQATGFNKTTIYLNIDKKVDKATESYFKANIHKRAQGEPLQYILGKWEFLGVDFAVGPGVLIPRPETEILVELAVKELSKRKKETVVFDLCAGTGCVGLSVAKLCTNANVYLLEKSPEAIEYLKRNDDSFQLNNTTLIVGDIFKGFRQFGLPNPDIILSNPPYIATAQIKTLQTELTFEPRDALDGGSDGLDFYRAINEHWSPYLNIGGVLAFECGETQAESLCKLFSQSNNQISVECDYNNIERFVLITNNEDDVFS